MLVARSSRRLIWAGGTHSRANRVCDELECQWFALRLAARSMRPSSQAGVKPIMMSPSTERVDSGRALVCARHRPFSTSYSLKAMLFSRM